MPDLPPEAVKAGAEALQQHVHGFGDWEDRARVVLDAAAPVLADNIASAILRYADQNEPPTGSGAYLAWHRHFEAASAVAAKAFGRDNLEAASVQATTTPPAG